MKQTQSFQLHLRFKKFYISFAVDQKLRGSAVVDDLMKMVTEERRNNSDF